MNMHDRLLSFYKGYDEEHRLSKDNAHRIEFLTTISYLDRMLTPGSAVLDICAGAGAYAFHLAEHGHRVAACDLSPHHVALLRGHPMAHRLTGISQGNATDLRRFEDAVFDAALCMGALYHIKQIESRHLAVREAARVTKKGGLVVLSYINRVPAAIVLAQPDLHNMDELLAVLNRGENDIFHYTSPGEMADLAQSCGIAVEHNIAADGLVYAIGPKANLADEDDFQKWMRFHLDTCERPDLLGASLHGLLIGRRVQ